MRRSRREPMLVSLLREAPVGREIKTSRLPLVSFSLVKENLTKSSVYLMRPFSVQECSGSSLTILDLTIFSAPATAWRRILVAE
jgi:hypothetical protein